MKKILITMLLALSAHAANFTWTATFSGDPWNAGAILYNPSWNGTVGKIEVTQLGANAPTATLSLEPAFLPQDPTALWLELPWLPFSFSDYLYNGVPVPQPSWLTTVEGTETWLKPFWLVNGEQYQGWWSATFGAPVEWEDPIEPPPPIDPPPIDPGGGGGEIPEPSTYALLSALGLLGFALRRRLCQG